MQEGQPIAFYSGDFNSAELKHIVSEKEMWKSMHTIHTWLYYLEGSQFMLVTDSYPNTFLKMQLHLNM